MAACLLCHATHAALACYVCTGCLYSEAGMPWSECRHHVQKLLEHGHRGIQMLHRQTWVQTELTQTVLRQRYAARHGQASSTCLQLRPHVCMWASCSHGWALPRFQLHHCPPGHGSSSPPQHWPAQLCCPAVLSHPCMPCNSIQSVKVTCGR